MNEAFLKDVIDGMSRSPKRLPSKYFYDERGSALFVEIMSLPEYYLTDAEDEIFSEKTEDIIKALDPPKDKRFELIELGAGSGSKTLHLTRALLDKGHDFDYKPVDISQKGLDILRTRFDQALPELEINSMKGDYFKILEDLADPESLKYILFLGSTLGNMEDTRAAAFLSRISRTLHNKDKLVLGLDLIKDESIIRPAYDDSRGLTSEFNLNLLKRINRQLGGNFEVESFEHVPKYDAEEGVARSFLRSDKEQIVTLKNTDRSFRIKKGEMIATEISRKYDDSILRDLIRPTGFTIADKITDSRSYFADYILVKNKTKVRSETLIRQSV